MVSDSLIQIGQYRIDCQKSTEKDLSIKKKKVHLHNVLTGRKQ